MPKQADTLASFVKSSQITEYGWKYIHSLCKTVAYRYYKSYDTEDLISMAIPDLAEFIILIEKGDNVPRSIRNVLFTRVRNSMSNYLYHRRKDVPTEDEILDTQASKDYDSVDILYNFTTIEEAHLLSLKLWRCYEGTRETTEDSEY